MSKHLNQIIKVALFRENLPDSQQSIIYLSVYIILIFGQSASPEFLCFNLRLLSFPGSIDEDSAVSWAKSGFYSNGVDSARCCCCDAQTGITKATDPEHVHRKHKADCSLLQLVRALEQKSTEPDAKMAAEMARFEKLIQKLSLFLASAKLGFVESFGFSKALTTLGAVRVAFKTNFGERSWRVGDLIEMVQSFSGDVLELADSLAGVLSDITERRMTNHIQQDWIQSSLTPTQNDFINVTTGNQQNTLPSDASLQDAAQKAQSDSPMCNLCGCRPRDVVLLPCGHLLFCQLCVRTARSCPSCGKEILAPKIVFLT